MRGAWLPFFFGGIEKKPTTHIYPLLHFLPVQNAKTL